MKVEQCGHEKPLGKVARCAKDDHNTRVCKAVGVFGNAFWGLD